MIVSIRGKIIERNPSFFIIETLSGVGYQVFVSINTFEKIIQKKQEEIHIIIQQIIKEDKHLLYGFYDSEEKDIFNQLISVSGVGTTTAIVILSYLSVLEAKRAIINGEESVFKSVKGIGSKTAQRIILDLKDKIDFLQQDGSSINLTLIDNNIRQDALKALLSLGFLKSAVEKALDRILKSEVEGIDNTEKLVKQALKIL